MKPTKGLVHTMDPADMSTDDNAGDNDYEYVESLMMKSLVDVDMLRQSGRQIQRLLRLLLGQWPRSLRV